MATRASPPESPFAGVQRRASGVATFARCARCACRALPRRAAAHHLRDQRQLGVGQARRSARARRRAVRAVRVLVRARAPRQGADRGFRRLTTATPSSSPRSAKSTPTRRSSSRAMPIAGPDDEARSALGGVARSGLVVLGCSAGAEAARPDRGAREDRRASRAQRRDALRAARARRGAFEPPVRDARARSGLRLEGAEPLVESRVERARRARHVAAAVLRRARLHRAVVAGDPDTDGDGLARFGRLSACSSRKTRTATSTRTAVRRSTTTSTSSLDANDKCPLEPEDPRRLRGRRRLPGSRQRQGHRPRREGSCARTSSARPTQEPLGCPAKPALVVVTDCEVKITQQIHFEYNKDKIRPESFPILDAVVEVLNKNPDIKIEVQGHTDNRGSAAYNKDLSNRRSASVQKVPGLARRPGRATHLAGLRLRPAHRGQLHRAESCAQSARPIRENRRGQGRLPEDRHESLI